MVDEICNLWDSVQMVSKLLLSIIQALREVQTDYPETRIQGVKSEEIKYRILRQNPKIKESSIRQYLSLFGTSQYQSER